MDAKPQRVSKFRLGTASANATDENIDPNGKLIHDRLKSTSNLKTAMNMTGAMSVAPKRAAFGDLSNTSKVIVDIGGKDLGKNRQTALAPRELKAIDKENQANIGVSISQKDANMAGGPKQTLNSQGLVVPSLAVSKAIAPTHSIPVVHKQAPSKKATIIYQDPVPAAQGASLAGANPAAEKQFKNPRHYKSQPYLRAQQPVLRRTQSKLPGTTARAVDVEDDLIEAVYEDAVEQLPEKTEMAQEKSAGIIDEEPNVIIHGDAEVDLPQEDSTIASAPLRSEQYWDDDDEQELYEDPEYTTAHSYRSHGDNTTGGPTTMLGPKVTDNVEKELELAKAYVIENQSEEEIEDEAWDVSMVAEYGEDIFEYMRELELRMLPDPHYMDIQTEIQWSMRAVLMDWLVQVHHRFSLLPETLFLTVNYIDRFLSVKVVSLGKLQLVGATAIFVAAKYEEINCPSVQEIVYMVDQGYTSEEILKAERFMLAMLNFELGWPGPMSYLRRISKADDYDLETRTLAKYFLEVTVMDERFVSSPPSFLAAGAHCLARMVLRKGDWTPGHVHYSGYTLAQLKPLLMMIFECCQDPQKHHRAVFEKYAGLKYKEAAVYVEREIRNGFTLTFPSQAPPTPISPSLGHQSPRLEYSTPGPLLIPTLS